MSKFVRVAAVVLLPLFLLLDAMIIALGLVFIGVILALELADQDLFPISLAVIREVKR